MQDAPKLRVAIVGSGLAGLSTAVELLDQVSRGKGRDGGRDELTEGGVLAASSPVHSIGSPQPFARPPCCLASDWFRGYEVDIHEHGVPLRPA